MVADEQRAAFCGNVIAPVHANPVNRPREQPKDEPQQGVGQKKQGVNRARQRQHAAEKENPGGIQMRDLRQQEMRARRQKNADERQQVGRGQHLALFLLVRTMLQQRGNRHDEKAAKETQRRDQNHGARDRSARQHKRCGYDRHADCAERHQAVLDLAAGKVPGRHAARPDAQRQRHPEPPDAHFVQMQHLEAVEKQVQEQQLAEKTEIGVADHRQNERPVAAP